MGVLYSLAETFDVVTVIKAILIDLLLGDGGGISAQKQLRFDPVAVWLTER